MAKVIALDIGGKRTGVAETDPLKMIASPLATVATTELMTYLERLIGREEVETIVLGEPRGLDGGDSDNSDRVRQWAKKIRRQFPDIGLAWQDERYSSKRAAKALVQSGVKKQRRQKKGSLDAVSAALILQDYLE